MSSVFANLEPQQVWKLFEDICAIPHGSKNEAELRTYIEKVVKAHGCVVKKDAAGNLCISVSATPGCEHAPSVILQAHLDMVCEKNELTRHDFRRDGVRCIRDGDWIRADGTTLGADNGIGVAAAVALALSENISHGPLEILLTVDEETGLTGALHLSPELITGSMMINLDSENSHAVCIGCAGGGGVTSMYELELEAPKKNYLWRDLWLTGLQGGHSGMNIHENRANAVKLMARLLRTIDSACAMRLADFQSGDKHNAIPREARACIGIPEGKINTMQSCLSDMFDRFKNEYPHEPLLEITEQSVSLPAHCYTQETTRVLLNLLLAFPHGVLAMSRTMSGLVETSNNLSSVHLSGKSCTIHNTPRSSRPERLAAVIEQICAVTELAGGKTIQEPTYPGWEPNPDSELLRLYEQVYAEVFGHAPFREAVHAGLECGIIGQKKPDLDMIAIGPDIRNCHSPHEAVSITSVQKFWTVLVRLLERIGKMKAA